MSRAAAPSVLFVVKGLDLGGLERVVTDLAIGLLRRQVPVEVAVINSSRDQLVPALQAAGVPVHLLGGTDLVGIRAAARLRALVRSGRFDVVHAHGPLPSMLARLSCRRGRRPVVVTTVHNVWASFRTLSRAGMRLTARRDAAAVAVSDAVAASLPAACARRCRVIPHGADLDACAAALARAPRVRAELAAPDEVLAVTVASHRPQKNYPNLIAAVAAARARGVPLHLVAVGEGAELVAHERLAAALGLAGHVSFIAPRIDVLDVIAAADVFVLASDFEGQPLVVVEALATGRPVVATAVGRVPELASKAGRIVPPSDSDALADALVELGSDAELRQRLGTAALEAAPTLSLEASIDAHLDLYRSVLP